MKLWQHLMAQQVAAGGVAYRYWRIYVTATASTNYFSLTELELRGTVGGSDLTSPSTPTLASSTLGGYSASLAVDNDTTAFGFISNPGSDGSAGSMSAWHRSDLGSAQVVREVAIYTFNDATVAPKDFLVQGSNDGTTFYTVKAFTGATHATYSWRYFEL